MHVVNTNTKRFRFPETVPLTQWDDGSIRIGGTRVTLAVRQQMRGTARFAGWIVRRGTRRVLDDALGALGSLHGA